MLIAAIAILSTIVLVPVLHYLVLRPLVDEWAREDVYVTYKTQSELKAIMKGDTRIEWIYDLEGKKLDEHFDVHPLKPNEPPVYSTLAPGYKMGLLRQFLRWFFEKYYGVVWVGIEPYHVLVYQFAWIKYDQENGVTKYHMVPRDELVDSIFSNYSNYGLPIDDAETGAGSLGQLKDSDNQVQKVPVHVDFTFETETINPDRSLFRATGLSTAGDWILSVAAVLTSHLKAWIGSKTYEQLISVNTSPEQKEELQSILKEVNDEISTYGQRINKLQFINVDLKDEELKSAARKLFIAEQDRLAAVKIKLQRIELAEAEYAKAERPVAGLAAGLAKIAAIPGGIQAWQAQQLSNSKITVYAPGGTGTNLLVQATQPSEPAPRQNQPTPVATTPAPDDRPEPENPS